MYRVRLIRLLLVLTAILLFGQTAWAEAEDNPWEFQGEKDDVKLYWRGYPDSAIPEFLAITQIPAAMAQVLGVLLDVESCPQWVDKCREAVLVGQLHPDQQIIYQVNKVPLAKDRDILFSAKIDYEDAGRRITIHIDSASDYCDTATAPVCEKIRAAQYVRVEQLQGFYRLVMIDENLVEVTWQQHLELGGNLPAWIVRSKLDDLAYRTLAGLCEQVKKPQYQDLQLHITEGNLSVTRP